MPSSPRVHAPIVRYKNLEFNGARVLRQKAALACQLRGGWQAAEFEVRLSRAAGHFVVSA